MKLGNRVQNKIEEMIDVNSKSVKLVEGGEIVYESKKRIEEVIFSNGESFKLLDDYNYDDGGVIIKISDNETVKKCYDYMGFSEEQMIFEDYTTKEEVGISNVFCKLDIKEGDGGYSVFYDKDMNYLMEL